MQRCTVAKAASALSSWLAGPALSPLLPWLPAPGADAADTHDGRRRRLPWPPGLLLLVPALAADAAATHKGRRSWLAGLPELLPPQAAAATVTNGAAPRREVVGC